MGTEDRINRRDEIAASIVARHQGLAGAAIARERTLAEATTSIRPLGGTTEFPATTKTPLATGCFDYFPDALLAVAEVSRVAQVQHGIEGDLKWDRSIAPNEADALARHFLKRGTFDTDGQRHTAKVAWRALALLQKEIEAARLETT